MLDSRHPSYDSTCNDWAKMRACYAGEDAIKEGGQIYLPAAAGQIIDWAAPSHIQGQGLGQLRYQAYKQRAVYPDFISEAVKAMIGVMHNKPPVIELPKAMEPLLERATTNGEPLPILLRRINEAQLIVGRIGLLIDLPARTISGSALPYIATYDAERILNWDDGTREEPTIQTLNLVVLDESEKERQTDFQWKWIRKYRALVLGDVSANEGFGIYRQALFRDTNAFTETALTAPSLRGIELDRIPFIFINTTDSLPEPAKPPLLELANLCLTIYRGEADYRQNLYMQAQDTLVVKTNKDEAQYKTGAGAALTVPIDGDAKYIGVGSAGLAEQRQALENDKRRASEMAAQLMDTTSRQKESGEALKMRVAAQTASLHQLALTGAAGLQAVLRVAAEWLGLDAADVRVMPNLEFADTAMTPRDFLELAQAKEHGLPIDNESLYRLLKKNKYTEKEFEEIQAEMDMERTEATNTLNAAMERFGAGTI